MVFFLSHSWPFPRVRVHLLLLVSTLTIFHAASKRHRLTPAYQKFCRQMYHASLALVYEPLKTFMNTPEII